MTVKQHPKFVLISLSQETFSADSLSEIVTFYKEQNIVLDTNYTHILKKNVSLFLKLSKQCSKNGTSFVIFDTENASNEVHDNLNIVPTLIEAEDLIDMEHIERQLGF